MRTSLIGLSLVLAASLVTAGEITAPEEGSCHGPDALPVYVQDSFDPSFERTYTPRGGLSKIFASDGSRAEAFGKALVLFDDRLAVGATGIGFDRPGAVYIYRLTGDRWVEEQKLTAVDTYAFGRSIVVSGGELIVGSSDGVFVYRLEGGSWTLAQRLEVFDTPSYTRFGEAVAAAGDTLFVGAPGGVGTVYVFGREDGRWVETGTLVGSDVGFNDNFAEAVAADGDTLAVGAELSDFRASQSGAVYIFERSGDSWVQKQKIAGHDLHQASYFGNAVSISGDLLVVGARNAWNPGPHAGAGYVFERTGGAWVQILKLRDYGSVSHGAFGASVHAAPDLVLAGAPRSTYYGAVMVYRRDPAGNWTYERLVNRFDSRGDGFGASVFSLGDILAFGESDGYGLVDSSGAAYVDGAIPPSTYEMHGDYTVTLDVTDQAGVRHTDSVSFTIDLRPPRVYPRWLTHFTVPMTMPFADWFSTSDHDSAAGDVIQERVVWDECVIFDGFTYGDRDGLLTDEIMVLDEPTLCDAMRRCYRDEFVEPRVWVEAVDCAGNVGRQRKVIPVVPAFGLERCD